VVAGTISTTRQYDASRKNVHWNIDPVLVDFGPVEIRWYGVFFVVGLYLAAGVLERTFARRGFSVDDARWLTVVLAAGMIVGAHLFHLVFYEPRSFLEHPGRIFQLGYGLSSHGGAVGSFAALWLYCRRRRRPLVPYADATIVAAVWVFPWVRIGNFFNSEIIGKPADVPWAVVFEREDLVPRHPSQIYEALLGVALIVLATRLERVRARDGWRPGRLLSIVLCVYFTARFSLEWFKSAQTTVLEGFPLSMGQVLSAPLALLGLWFAIRLRGPSRREDAPPR
jgi:prolipoprotein diacylglyceryl transferase